MREAFKKLSLSWEEGDKLAVYGFSRGAFAAYGVESLSAWLGGLLEPDCFNDGGAKFDTVFKAWESSHASPLTPAVIQEWEQKGIKIRDTGRFELVVMLDPVNSVTHQYRKFMKRFTWLDSFAKGNAKHYFSILSRHEHRHKFRCIQIAEVNKGSEAINVWVDGVHIEVGGGGATAGLNRISLACMIEYTMEVLKIVLKVDAIIDAVHAANPNWDDEPHAAWSGLGHTWRVPMSDFLRGAKLDDESVADQDDKVEIPGNEFEDSDADDDENSDEPSVIDDNVQHAFHCMVRCGRAKGAPKHMQDPPPYDIVTKSPDEDGKKVDDAFKSFIPKTGGHRTMRIKQGKRKGYHVIRERPMSKREADILNKLCKGINEAPEEQVMVLRPGVEWVKTYCKE